MLQCSGVEKFFVFQKIFRLVNIQVYTDMPWGHSTYFPHLPPLLFPSPLSTIFSHSSPLFLPPPHPSLTFSVFLLLSSPPSSLFHPLLLFSTPSLPSSLFLLSLYSLHLSPSLLTTSLNLPPPPSAIFSNLSFINPFYTPLFINSICPFCSLPIWIYRHEHTLPPCPCSGVAPSDIITTPPSLSLSSPYLFLLLHLPFLFLLLLIFFSLSSAPNPCQITLSNAAWGNDVIAKRVEMFLGKTGEPQSLEIFTLNTGCIKKNWTNLKSLTGFVKRRNVRRFLLK